MIINKRYGIIIKYNISVIINNVNVFLGYLYSDFNVIFLKF